MFNVSIVYGMNADLRHRWKRILTCNRLGENEPLLQQNSEDDKEVAPGVRINNHP
jgi:hypothetical protein